MLSTARYDCTPRPNRPPDAVRHLGPSLLMRSPRRNHRRGWRRPPGNGQRSDPGRPAVELGTSMKNRRPRSAPDRPRYRHWYQHLPASVCSQPKAQLKAELAWRPTPPLWGSRPRPPTYRRLGSSRASARSAVLAPDNSILLKDNFSCSEFPVPLEQSLKLESAAGRHRNECRKEPASCDVSGADLAEFIEQFV